MVEPPVIEARDISKSFRIPGVRRETVREPVLGFFRPPPVQTLDVLRDVSLEVRRGETAERARTLGWREVVVIDDDLGKSGASATGRVGFQRLVATIGLGQAGAVFGLEVSRLARNNRCPPTGEGS